MIFSFTCSHSLFESPQWFHLFSPKKNKCVFFICIYFHRYSDKSFYNTVFFCLNSSINSDFNPCYHLNLNILALHKHIMVTLKLLTQLNWNAEPPTYRNSFCEIINLTFHALIGFRLKTFLLILIHLIGIRFIVQLS